MSESTPIHGPELLEQRQIEPLTDSKLRDFYVKGIIRNVTSVMVGVFGTEAQISGAGRGRGDKSSDLLFFLFQSSTLQTVARRIARAIKRGKQGNASFHDLAIAHALYCTLQYATHGAHDRHSIAIVGSMPMGRLIQPLRELTRRIFSEHKASAFEDLSDTRIEKDFPAEVARLKSAIETAKTVNSKSKAKRLDPSLFELRRLVSAFALISSAGLDHHPFDQFLTEEI